MNVVAASLGIRDRPDAFLRRAGRRRPGRATARRPCGAAASASAISYGFVFGNGLMANFLDEYYGRTGDYGPSARHLADPAGARLGRDGRAVRAEDLSALRGDGRSSTAAAPRSRHFVGVGAAPCARWAWASSSSTAPTRTPSASAVLAIHAGPLALIPRPGRRSTRGRGIAPRRACSAVASAGDRAEERRCPTPSTAISTGPEAPSWRSPVGPPVTLREATSAALIVAPRGDTIDRSRHELRRFLWTGCASASPATPTSA